MLSYEAPLLELRNIEKSYSQQSWPGIKKFRAVRGVSLSIRRGETLGLVGESGCGKSTVGRMTARLLEPSAGELHYKGSNITDAGGRTLRQLRQEIQYVFQDPYTSLNPRFTVGRLLEEPLKYNQLGNRLKRKRDVLEMLDRIGLNASYRNRYPHELSGGQRQRVGIARALMMNPEFVVLDEPVSALDVSVQAQILNLLKSLQHELSLTYLFISHDLNVVHYVSDRVAVMYLGNIVEIADVHDLYDRPLHPYTQALVSSIPAERGAAKREQIILSGDLPDPTAHISGCPFRSRCLHAFERCESEMPGWSGVGEGHAVRCHLWEGKYASPEAAPVEILS
ncbi:ABC transporter ATP-binding protein [Paenibacillus sp. Y412MC10]|uniref:ABC transporter ATP-binding protein n=1 Tax=Geobacillus sp. (strain Y412MC10) TaxID=481743 RepID=UPI0001789BF3|nr:oligopeptide/dipeptide ABC transporter ATP-binding protein [Paenibacillus sp. Y412MC10]ACX65361.1 oligopeptide/dipeptide ABC transporter, ATPase subunit [Paenibacillus sp. Y412MC10]